MFVWPSSCVNIIIIILYITAGRWSVVLTYIGYQGTAVPDPGYIFGGLKAEVISLRLGACDSVSISVHIFVCQNLVPYLEVARRRARINSIDQVSASDCPSSRPSLSSGSRGALMYEYAPFFFFFFFSELPFDSRQSTSDIALNFVPDKGDECIIPVVLLTLLVISSCNKPSFVGGGIIYKRPCPEFPSCRFYPRYAAHTEGSGV